MLYYATIITEIQLKTERNRADQLLVPNHRLLESVKLHLAESTSPTSLLLQFPACSAPVTWASLQQLTEAQLSPASCPLHTLLFTSWNSLPMALGRLTHAHPWGLSFIVPSQGDCPWHPGQSRFPLRVSGRAFCFPLHCLKLHVS